MVESRTTAVKLNMQPMLRNALLGLAISLKQDRETESVELFARERQTPQAASGRLAVGRTTVPRQLAGGDSGRRHQSGLHGVGHFERRCVSPARRTVSAGDRAQADRRNRCSDQRGAHVAEGRTSGRAILARPGVGAGLVSRALRPGALVERLTRQIVER
jgi:hypothetical protein